MINQATLDALLAAGASAEMIVVAVKAELAAHEAAEAEKLKRRREMTAERQRRRRARNAMSRDVAHVTRDERDTPHPPLLPPCTPLNSPPLPPEPLQQQPSLVAASEAAAAKGRRQELDDLTAKLTEAAGLDPGCAGNPGFAVLAPILGLVDAGYSLDEDILPVLRAKRHQAAKARGWGFYVDAIREARERRLGIAATPAPKGRDLCNPFARMLANGWQQKPEHYDQLCKSWFTRKSWPDPDVPVPGKEGSFVPLEHVERWLRANRKLIAEAA